MIISACIDESGTHDGSSLTMMAGYVGYSGQWRKFDKKWSRALSKAGLTHFHAKDFVKRSGEFRGWDGKLQTRFLDKAERLCRRNTMFGFAASFKNSDYEEFYIAKERPKKMPLNSRYGLCFRLVLCFLPEMIYQIFTDEKGRDDVTLNIILEAGHKNAGDAVRIFDLFKKQADPRLAKLLGILTFAEKTECMGVQGADSLAYSAYRVEQRPDLQLVPVFDYAKEDWSPALAYVKGLQPVFRLAGTPNILRDFRENIFAQIAARQQFGQQRSIASSSSVPERSL